MFTQQGFARRNEQIRPSAIREALKVTAQSDIISFAGGLPAQELFPVQEIAAACQHVLRDQASGAFALQYGPSEGYAPLRELIAADLDAEGIRVAPDQVLITTGSQQGLDLAAKIFLDPGDAVLLENPTYLGALSAFNAYEASYLTVATDTQGMRVDEVERLLATSPRLPKFIYLVPNFSNPLGTTLSADRRTALTALAREYGVPVLEDDPYVLTRFEGATPPSLRALGGDATILLRSFSKTVSPGFRLGIAVAAPEILARMVAAKQACDLHTSTFLQQVMFTYLLTGHLTGHMEKVRDVYRRRRDVMLRALAVHFPPGCSWNVPSGGLFVWVTLPVGVDAEAMLPAAVAERVAFIPGNAFHPKGGGANTMRLNFSQPDESAIEEGIMRLAAVVERALIAAPAVARVHR